MPNFRFLGVTGGAYLRFEWASSICSLEIEKQKNKKNQIRPAKHKFINFFIKNY